MEGKRVLIVDDEESLRDELSSALRASGFETIEARSCREAEELIGVKRPDVAIIDRRLPDGDGQEWLQRFKKASQNTSFVLLTGFGDYDSAIDGYTNGLEGYFEKPPDMEKLINTLKRIVSQNDKKDDISGTMSSVAHEIINPLTIIKEAISCTRDGLTGPITNETKDMLNISIRQISRLTTFTEGMINSDLIEQGEFPFHPKMTKVAPLIADMAESIKADFIKNNLKLDLKLSPELDSAYIDGDLFSHVFFNLVHNAVKFSIHGKRIGITARPEDGGFIMSVSDEGTGIPPEEKENIFKKYHKVGEKSKTGKGIGLYIVKQIVDLHGGSINVESEVGRGSTFNVWIPLNAGAVKGGPHEKGDDSR